VGYGYSVFFCGSVFFLFRDQIVLNKLFAFLSALILLVAVFTGIYYVNHSGGLFYIIAPVPLTYLIFYFAEMSFFCKINSKNDLSYGLYIYGTFVLSCLAYLKLTNSWLLYFLSSLIISYFLAVFSWFLVERPCLSLKNYSLNLSKLAIKKF
jgi:peptidoglycan/LPS O-acetylase OafA/YrhL